ncbi:vanillate monooxygenase (plasmid) [Azospirillum sp. B510]|uniref:PDR/VanB family oxidoreductase n=1 Tax=Azospirillum sp. (strain B510) TaxID=137722 RepID=UPI0001C4C6C4|nr:PDR/VanB family oxidoreductase [Azospirillum sp. B510]BAI75025.1 vanillate monooxygenase [Azospirillum sp. B510]
MRFAIDWQDARLRAVRDLAPDIRLFEIEPAISARTAAPGSHISVTVAIDGRTDTRCYSLIGDAADGLYRIAVKRLPESRGGSAYMWTLEPGARLRISAPQNLFELALDRPDYLLIAGGIGITPIHGMALALAARGARLRLLYACRKRAELAFADELGDRLGDRLETFVDEEGQRMDLAAAIAGLAPDGELYLCGPIGLMEAVRRQWREAGRPMERLRFESFGNSGRYAPESFTVHIPRLGKSVTVPENRSMLDALEAAGVELLSDCRRGECGLCAVDILGVEGEVDHRDVFFSEQQQAENHRLCACVSRVASVGGGVGRGGAITIDTARRD